MQDLDPDLAQDPIVVDRDGGLTLREAADRLGITERTLRSRIKEGKAHARKIIGPKGQAVYRVYLDDPVPALDQDPVVDPPWSAPDPVPDLDRAGDPDGEKTSDNVGGFATEDFGELVALLRDQQQTIMELSGRCGWLQAENQRLQEEVRLLKAPTGAECSSRRPWWRFWGRD